MNRSMLIVASRWALFGLVLGLTAFLFNYYMAPTSLPGYEIFAAPAMFSLQFFSHEIAFWPKLAIFLAGQFFLCFIAVFFCLFMTNRLNN